MTFCRNCKTRLNPWAKFCPECGKEVFTIKACSKCGTDIEEGARFCPECGNVVAQIMKCANCGSEMDKWANFCPECGSKQEYVAGIYTIRGFDLGEVQYQVFLKYSKDSWGTQKNMDKALEWLRKSAEHKNTDAERTLGEFYLNGTIVKRDEKLALEWLKKASEKGDKIAKQTIDDFEQEKNALQKMLDEEAISHDAKLQREIARKYLHNKELETSVYWYRKSAEQGYADAQNALAFRYYEGDGVQKDFAEAVKWWQKAAEQGNSTSQCYLAWRYYLGEGVEKNLEESTKWWLKAAEQGNSEAQRCLGNNYSNGEGVEKNPVEAAKWWLKAAEQGDASAQCNMGWAYNNGEGVQKDMNAAVQWYRKAAANGNETAKKNLQNMEYVILENPHVERSVVYLNVNSNDWDRFQKCKPDYMRNCILKDIQSLYINPFNEIQRVVEFDLAIDVLECRQKYGIIPTSLNAALFSEQGQRITLDFMTTFAVDYEATLDIRSGQRYENVHIPIRFDTIFLRCTVHEENAGSFMQRYSEWSIMDEYPLPAGNYYLQIKFDEKTYRTPLFYFDCPELEEKYYKDDVYTMVESNKDNADVRVWAQKQNAKWTKKQEESAHRKAQLARWEAEEATKRQAQQNAIYWWICKYCSKTIKSANLPDRMICPVRQNTDHFWNKMGRAGNVAWACKKCGLVVYMAEDEIPSDLGCLCPTRQNEMHNFNKV